MRLMTLGELENRGGVPKNAGIFDACFPISNMRSQGADIIFCLTMTVRIRGAFVFLLCNAAIADAAARAHQGLNVLGVAEDSVGRLQHAQKSFDEAASVGRDILNIRDGGLVHFARLEGFACGARVQSRVGFSNVGDVGGAVPIVLIL